MANTKRPQSKNERQENLVKPVEQEIVFDGNLEVVTDEATKVALLEAELVNLKAQLEATKAHATKSTRTAKPKAERVAEKSAMSAHLTDEGIAAIQASEANSLYAFLASETQVQPKAKHGRKTTTTIEPHDQWKPAAHFSAEDALEVVRLHNEEGLKPSAIAQRMGCSPTYVGRILSGQQWGKVTKIVFVKKVSA